MFRFITAAILIALAVVGFITFTGPLYHDVGDLRAQVAQYDEALGKAKDLEDQRDKLTTKYNSIPPENLDRLQKFLPDNVDNIRLILEIEKIALPYGMVLRNVKYDTLEEQNPAGETVPAGSEGAALKDYGSWNLEFSTAGTYSNFLNLLTDLERNLRVLDISSIEFSSDVGPGANLSSNQTYNYDFKIKTYWLKN